MDAFLSTSTGPSPIHAQVQSFSYLHRGFTTRKTSNSFPFCLTKNGLREIDRYIYKLYIRKLKLFFFRIQKKNFFFTYTKFNCNVFEARSVNYILEQTLRLYRDIK